MAAIFSIMSMEGNFFPTSISQCKWAMYLKTPPVSSGTGLLFCGIPSCYVPTEAEIQAALEAIQQMVGGVGANAPTSTTAPASTPAPSSTPATTAPVTTAPASGNLDRWTAVTDSPFGERSILDIA